MPFFSPKTWKQRIVEFPGRRRLDDTSAADVYDVSRAEGTVMQEGDGFTATNMNNLEQRIKSAMDQVETSISSLNSRMPDYVDFDITTTANEYVAPFEAYGQVNYDTSKIISCFVIGTEGAKNTLIAYPYSISTDNNTLSLVSNKPGKFKVRVYHS